MSPPRAWPTATTAAVRPCCCCTAARSPPTSGGTSSRCCVHTSGASHPMCSASATPRPQPMPTGRCPPRPPPLSGCSTRSTSTLPTSWPTITGPPSRSSSPLTIPPGSAARSSLLRYALRSGRAVHDPAVLTPELLRGYIAANLADRHRRAKTRRFLAGQLDPANNRATSDALPGLRSFNHPTLIVWGRDDPHFGPEWAERLRRDIPGVVRLELLPDAGHLLMEERPHELARLLIDFLTEQQPAPTPTDTEVRHG